MNVTTIESRALSCYDHGVNSQPPLESFLVIAEELARRAGRLALERMDSARASRKADASIVTDADLAAQHLIIEGVARRFPDHAVLGEEDRSDSFALPAPDTADYCWVIDPVDGTRNFARGFPCFGVSLALLLRGMPVVGVVYDPLLDRSYGATADGEASWDKRALRVSADTPRSDLLVGVPSGHNRPMPEPVRRWLDRMNLRNVGSTALHLAYVAAGWLDAAWCRQCYVWDIAAGWLLVRQAGGVITHPSGEPLFPLDLGEAARRETPFLAAGPKLHAELLAELRKD